MAMCAWGHYTYYVNAVRCLFDRQYSLQYMAGQWLFQCCWCCLQVCRHQQHRHVLLNALGVELPQFAVITGIWPASRSYHWMCSRVCKTCREHSFTTWYVEVDHGFVLAVTYTTTSSQSCKKLLWRTTETYTNCKWASGRVGQLYYSLCC